MITHSLGSSHDSRRGARRSATHALPAGVIGHLDPIEGLSSASANVLAGRTMNSIEADRIMIAAFRKHQR